MSNRVTRGKLHELFMEGSMISKLNKDDFIAKIPSIRHDKEEKGIKFYFDFTKDNNNSDFDSFTILVIPDREHLEKDSIELALIGLKPGVVFKKVSNDFDTFFKTFIQLRDEYIELKGEFKESNKEKIKISREVEELRNKEMKAMKDSLNKYV